MIQERLRTAYGHTRHSSYYHLMHPMISNMIWVVTTIQNFWRLKQDWRQDNSIAGFCVQSFKGSITCKRSKTGWGRITSLNAFPPLKICLVSLVSIDRHYISWSCTDLENQSILKRLWHATVTLYSDLSKNLLHTRSLKDCDKLLWQHIVIFQESLCVLDQWKIVTFCVTVAINTIVNYT